MHQFLFSLLIIAHRSADVAQESDPGDQGGGVLVVLMNADNQLRDYE